MWNTWKQSNMSAWMCMAVPAVLCGRKKLSTGQAYFKLHLAICFGPVSNIIVSMIKTHRCKCENKCKCLRYWHGFERIDPHISSVVEWLVNHCDPIHSSYAWTINICEKYKQYPSFHPSLRAQSRLRVEWVYREKQEAHTRSNTLGFSGHDC